MGFGFYLGQLHLVKWNSSKESIVLVYVWCVPKEVSQSVTLYNWYHD